MKMLLAVLVFLGLLVSSNSTAAEMRLTTPDIDIVLFDTPCSSKIVLDMLNPDRHPLYQNGNVTVPGRTVAFCWRVSPGGQEVWVVDEEGEIALIPTVMFTKEKTGPGV